jgi:hypothetical protein
MMHLSLLGMSLKILLSINQATAFSTIHSHFHILIMKSATKYGDSMVFQKFLHLLLHSNLFFICYGDWCDHHCR